jgi:hypothetical protein
MLKHILNKRKAIQFGLVLGFLAFLVSCSMADYGILRTNSETGLQFKKGRVLADHTYYYYGWKGEPDAIVAIHEDYRIASELWTVFDPADGALDALVARMTARETTRFKGAEIYDRQGNRLGVWWSDAWGATIKMSPQDDKVIAFIRPWPPVPRGDDEGNRPS